MFSGGIERDLLHEKGSVQYHRIREGILVQFIIQKLVHYAGIIFKH